MKVRLSELLSAVEVSTPSQSAGLQVFGLRWNAASTPDYVVLDHALASGLIEVTEVTEGGIVPQLRISNRGDSLVFMMSGELLVGAKQNRVLNVSMLVPPRSELLVPVSCVEAGRWSYRSRGFASSTTTSHGQLRELMAKQILASYRARSAPLSDQQEVWSEVSRKLHQMGSASESSALEQAFQDHEQHLNEIIDRLTVPEDCAGAAFVLNGRISGVDLFDKPSTLAKLWPKLVRGYSLDALEAGKANSTLTSGVVQEWVRSARAAMVERFESPGVGDDLRLESKDVIGAALVVEDWPVHVEMFVQAPPPTTRGAE